MVLFSVLFNTKGNFVKDPKLRYEGGEVFAFKGLDTDFWSYFEARDIIKHKDNEFDLASVNLWWMHSDGILEKDIKPFKDDKDAGKMAKFAVDNSCDVELFVEPKDSKVDLHVLLSQGKRVVESDVGQSTKPREVEDVDESQSEMDEDSSDDSVKDVHFDDSEEERILCLDDGFDELLHEVPLNVRNPEFVAATENILVGENVPATENAPLIENVPATENVYEKSGGKKKKKTHQNHTCEVTSLNLIIPEQEKLHVIDDEYFSDEMDSASEVDTDGEGRPPIVRFNSEEVMTKNFKFKIGMEFSSLRQFKDAILEHNVLNGSETKFEKNDADRCRVVCKRKKQCNYVVLCSRVVRTTTFRVKTLKGKHTCGSWLATTAGKRRFQVTHTMSNDLFIVDLDIHSCSCNFWDLVGIPCRHAVVSISRACEDPQSYVHRYYHKQSYIACYDETITPINGQKMWPKTEYPDILPPNYKRGPGRPKKLRRREPDEGNQQNWKRNNTTHRCKRCLKYGHNARTCKVPKPKEVATKGKEIVAINEGAAPSNEGAAPSNEGDSHLPIQGSQIEVAKKKVGRPKGSKNTKLPKVPKPPKAPKVQKALKASFDPNVSAEASAHIHTIEATNGLDDLIDPDVLSELLFSDEVPDMVAEKLNCSAPAASNIVNVVSRPTTSAPVKKRKCKSEVVKMVKQAKNRSSD